MYGAPHHNKGIVFMTKSLLASGCSPWRIQRCSRDQWRQGSILLWREDIQAEKGHPNDVNMQIFQALQKPSKLICWISHTLQTILTRNQWRHLHVLTFDKSSTVCLDRSQTGYWHTYSLVYFYTDALNMKSIWVLFYKYVFHRINLI